jgi:hypothetical protein
MIKNYFNYDDLRIKRYLSKEIDMDQNPINYMDSDQKNSIITAASTKDNAITNIDIINILNTVNSIDNITNLRDCMVGFNIDYKRTNLIVKQNEKLNIDVNFFMGQAFATYAYNTIPGNLKMTANINIILSDKYGNRKKYTIPVSYELSFNYK